LLPANARNALMNLTLIRTNFLDASLTIQVEMMAIPFLLGMFFLDRAFGIIGLFGAVAISIMSVEAHQLVLWLPVMNVFITAFAVGVLIADKRLAAAIGPVPKSAAPVAFVACLAFRAFLNTDATSAFLGEIFLCACLVLSVYHSGHPQSVFMRFLTSAPVQFLGRISYSLYLLNIVVLFVAWSIFDRYPWYSTHMLATGLTVGVIVTLVSLPLAYFSERFIERPGIAYGRAVLKTLLPAPKTPK
jgi:peptidoglycan/LPS O-acetylase OafA/YrhL